MDKFTHNSPNVHLQFLEKQLKVVDDVESAG
jgi:hypothetical protein